MGFICQPNRRRPIPAGPGEEIEGIFNRGLNVAETIAMLDGFEWDISDLRLVLASKKGKIQAWAKREIKRWAETPPEEPPN